MSSSDTDEMGTPPTTCTPPNIVNKATTTSNNLIPEKSRRLYEKAYKDFMDWRMNEGTTSMSENVLLAYFDDLSKKFNPASLWSYYSMLKSTLKFKHDINIEKYYKLKAFLKRKSEGYTAKKSKIFSPEQINQFMDEAPDQLYLQSKVGVIFGIMGACRRQELYNLKFNDVQVFDTTILATIRNTKTKTDRTFTITGSYSDLCKKYMALRPSECSEPSFFLHYVAGKCTTQRVGINKFGVLGKAIANFLNLPDPGMYTGHCFRRTSATLLVDSGADITTLKRHGGWKSTTVAEGYIDDSIQNKMKVSNQIINSIQKKEVININMPNTSNKEPGNLPLTTQAGQTPQLNISNCTTVNVYNYYNK